MIRLFCVEHCGAAFAEDRKVLLSTVGVVTSRGKMDLECRIRRQDSKFDRCRAASNAINTPEPDWIVSVIEDITRPETPGLALRKMAKTDAAGSGQSGAFL